MTAACKKMGVRKYFFNSLSGLRNWESREALELMNVFESHHFLFGVMSSDQDVWILMASALQDKGMEVTARQVDKKWARMRDTFKRIGEAKSSEVPTKELQKPLKKVRGLEEQDAVVERFLATTRRPPRPCLSRPCTLAPPQRTDDYETLKTMYKLSLVR